MDPHQRAGCEESVLRPEGTPTALVYEGPLSRGQRAGLTQISVHSPRCQARSCGWLRNPCPRLLCVRPLDNQTLGVFPPSTPGDGAVLPLCTPALTLESKAPGLGLADKLTSTFPGRHGHMFWGWRNYSVWMELGSHRSGGAS